MDYEGPEFMDFDAEVEPKIKANNWKLVDGKQKLQPHKEATKSPLPASPQRRNQTIRAPNTTHITMATTKEGPISSTKVVQKETEIETETEQN